MKQSDTPGDGGSPQHGGHGRECRCHGRGHGDSGCNQLLSNDRTAGIRNKKTIGTRKNNSEAAKSTGHAKDSDGPSGEHPMRNTQGMLSSMCCISDEQSNQPGGRAEQHEDGAQKVEPRSYRGVLTNG